MFMHTYIYCIVSLTINKLSLIKWMDQDKNKQKFRLVRKISDKWFDAGLLVGVPTTALESYSQRFVDNNKRCIQVLSDWINNGHPDYPPTWAGLYNLLCDIEKGTVAQELKKVLETKGIVLEDELDDSSFNF